MNKNFDELLKKFKIIARKRWIESVTNGHGNIGLTFEYELGKKIDSNYTPDFKNIEIKCTTRFSKFPISLFSIAFDGPTDKEIIRLNNTYGSYDKDFKDKKTLIKKIRVDELSNLKNKYFLSLSLEDEKLYICVYDKRKILIEKEAYVYLDSIKKHLLTKLNNLAFIKASKKKTNNKEYFRYYEISFYTLKKWITFIELLQNGEIEVTLNSRIQKSGIYRGRYFNKNLVFQIKKENIDKLFNKQYYYNFDIRENIDEIQFL